MRCRSVPVSEIRANRWCLDTWRYLDRLPPPSTHGLRATWEDGKGLTVTDAQGAVVQVTLGATLDNRTVYAHVEGLGFIGGWTYPHRAQPFKRIVESINRGRVYEDMNHLPNGRRGR